MQPKPISTTGLPSAGTLRALGTAVVALCVFWSVVIALVVYPALPYNAIEIPSATLLYTTVWAPQGWAFFTRSPRELQTLLFRRTGEGWISARLAPHGEPRNAFGLNRASRAQGTEAVLLTRMLPDSAWRKCPRTVTGDECLGHAAGPTLRNPVPNPTLCGPIGFVYQRRLPWAWSRHVPRPGMPASYATAEVVCSHQ